MIEIYVAGSANMWFGIAYTGEKIAATSFGSSERRAVESLLRSLPPNVNHRMVERESAFAARAILTLREAHTGKREFRDFVLAEEFFSKPVARVLKAAAAIPVGYVASYGDIARVAGTSPRAVGRIMASNPLYPVVPCHRVVGADFSLVGYGGRKTSDALKAKLARLIAESKGFDSERSVPIDGAILRVSPVERAITRARERGISLSGNPQHTLASWQSAQPSQ
jgi:methylated-DNA-[protein]-cysteine S-methyltransferase